MSAERVVRVAILDCDYTVPAIAANIGPFYSSLFRDTLLQAEQRANRGLVKLEFSCFDVLKNQYPDLDSIDAFIIPGSIAAVYDTDPWIQTLAAFIRTAYNDHSTVRIFGSCFGHQLICDALFAGRGLHVDKDPNGYEYGVKPVKLTQPFTNTFQPLSRYRLPHTVRMQVAHGDHVKIVGHAMPDSLLIVGETDHCKIQGVFQPSRILTFQGHFEFGPKNMYEFVKHFYTAGRGFTPQMQEEALRGTQQPDDAHVAADILYAFLASP